MAREPGWSPTHPDVYDETTHPCGCRIYFDVALWRSVAVTRCDDHDTDSGAPQ